MYTIDYELAGKVCLNTLTKHTLKTDVVKGVSLEDLGKFYHKALVAYKILSPEMLETLLSSWGKQNFTREYENRVLRYYIDTNKLIEQRKRRERIKAYERGLK